MGVFDLKFQIQQNAAIIIEKYKDNLNQDKMSGQDILQSFWSRAYCPNFGPQQMIFCWPHKYQKFQGYS